MGVVEEVGVTFILGEVSHKQRRRLLRTDHLSFNIVGHHQYLSKTGGPSIDIQVDRE